MTSKKWPQTPDTYDAMFQAGGDAQVFQQHYRSSCYYPMFDRIEKILRRRGLTRVFEVGCGTGAFAHLLMERGGYEYHGFDFSGEAVRQAVARTGAQAGFAVGDARAPQSYAAGCDYDVIVCTEVLEHVPEDLEVIGCWPRGKFVIATVPNFDSPYHVRFFQDAEAVRARYRQVIAIDAISVVKKPYLTDISAANYWRALRWARYRPRELIKILGWGRRADLGCWFILSGTT